MELSLLLIIMRSFSKFRRTSSVVAMVALMGLNTVASAANFYTVVPLQGKRSAGGENQQDNIRVALTSAVLPEGQVGVPYLYDLVDHLQVTGDPAFQTQSLQFTARGALPKGLALMSDGQLVGVVEPQATPTTSIPVSVAYKGHTAQADFEIKIMSISLGLTSASLPSAELGEPYYVNLWPYLAVSGGAPYAPILFRVVDGMLPGGLELDAVTGVISGTPTTIYLAGPIGISATHEDGYSSPVRAYFVLGDSW